MSRVEELRAQAQAYTEAGARDMTQVVKGSARLLPAGPVFMRLVEYIELGMQPQEFNGKSKGAQMEVQLGFALYGPEYQNEDGTPYLMRMFPMALLNNDKSKSFKMFKSMNFSGQFTNFAQMIGQFWIGQIVHEAKSKADPTIVSRIDPAGFSAPIDPMSRQYYALPEAPDSYYRMFLWDMPTKDAWDSLFVEGTFDDGKSKNRIQETIMAAENFAGSPIQLLVFGNNIPALPTEAPAAPVAAPATVPGTVALPPAGTAPVTPALASLPNPGVPANPTMPGVIPPSLPPVMSAAAPANPASSTWIALPGGVPVTPASTMTSPSEVK